MALHIIKIAKKEKGKNKTTKPPGTSAGKDMELS